MFALGLAVGFPFLNPHLVPYGCPALAVIDLKLVAVKASFHGKGTPAMDTLVSVLLAVHLAGVLLAGFTVKLISSE